MRTAAQILVLLAVLGLVATLAAHAQYFRAFYTLWLAALAAENLYYGR